MANPQFKPDSMHLAVLLVSLLFANSAIAQTSPQIEPAIKMPNDPYALMNLAAQSNGLEQEGIKPWHMTISFQTMDDKGNVKDKGTIEESWVGPHKYKRIYKTETLTQLDYGTEKGILRSGSHDPSTIRLEYIVNDFDQPIPVQKARENWILDVSDRPSGNLKLKCIQVKAYKTPRGDQPMNGPLYCLDADRPTLRISANPLVGTQVLYNNLRLFQSHTFPGDIESYRDNKIEFKAHLENFEQIGTVDEAAFIPPPDATLVERKIAISSAVAAGQLIKKVNPEYLPYALTARIQGVVTVRATIGKDGHISNAHAISGPLQLTAAAEEAVRHWEYKPYLLNGEPVLVDTQISVVFSLSR